MWIKRQQGYCLKEIEGISYLLPYGQKIADQKKGIVLNETGVYLWNALEFPMTEDALSSLLLSQYPHNDEIAKEIRIDVAQFVSQLISLGILQRSPFSAENLGQSKTDKENCPFAGWLTIAGMKIALYGSQTVISSQFDSFFCKAKNFQENLEQNRFDQQIELIQGRPKIHPSGEILIRNEEIIVIKSEEGYVVLFPSMNQIYEAHMTEDGRLVRIYRKEPVSDEDTEKTKEQLFHAIRHFFLFFVQRKGFFAIHSASILYHGQAWLFSGHSGMGKSTHTNLWKEQFGTEIINGDLNLVGWNESGRPIVYGMPWCGTSGIASTKNYPLGGIILLGRASDNHFEMLKKDQKIVRVMQRMVSPVWTKAMLEANLTCAQMLSEQIMILYFLCTKEMSAAEAMKREIDRTLDLDKETY